MAIFGRSSESRPDEPPATAPRKENGPAAKPAAATRCVIGSKTTLKGDLSGSEDVVVEGRVEGTVKLERDLIVAPGGSVHASVEARSVSVSGELKGDCKVRERVEIGASGRLLGNIKAPKVVIAEGAVFRGNSDMSGAGGTAGG